MNLSVGPLRWLIRRTFRDTKVPVPSEAGTVLWVRPSEYPSLLLGTHWVERDIAREWRALLRPGEVIFDIGANIGFTVQRFIALLDGNCRIWAFEPMPRNTELLKQNVSRFGHQVVVVEYAVGSRNGKAVMRDNRHHGGLSVLQGVPDTETTHEPFWQNTDDVEVPITTLDAYVEQHPSAIPTLIKLDVEGSAHWSLEGAVQVLRRHRPAISCSFHSDQEREGVVSVLKAEGYRGVETKNSGTLEWCPALESTGNFVHPSDPRMG